MNNDKIAFNVEHVFVEHGREVRKMPVEINGETIWVECVPGGGQGGVQGAEGRQQQGQQEQEGSIMMDLGDSDGLEIPGQGILKKYQYHVLTAMCFSRCQGRFFKVSVSIHTLSK